MILPDWQIRQLCLDGMVTPFDPVLLNPASLDVRLGPRIQVEQLFKRELRTVDISHTSAKRPYRVWPHQFLLAHTIETFDVPDHVAGEFKLKSSRAREAVNHLLAGFADPGYYGSVMTLELQNVRWFRRVPIWHGMRIGQMVFYLMAAPPLRSYAETGRYNGHSSVMGSLG